MESLLVDTKEYSKAERRIILNNICDMLEVVSASHADVLDAFNNESFKDFEDTLQEKCAETANMFMHMAVS